MPVEHSFDEGSNFLTTRFYGVLSDEDLIHQTKCVVGCERIRPGLRELVNLSDIERIAASKGSFQHVIQADIQHQDKLEGHLAAIVASSDYQFGLARMFEMMSESRGGPTTIHVFRTIDEAKSWLSSGGESSDKRK